ncbi:MULTISPECIES: hypothetical protein [unclassified Mesorhizobium]|uniref:hypothetical protein n=1 Tax=unclassified Mesorhizobium TaxID=325217 RepID=UPI0030152839
MSDARFREALRRAGLADHDVVRKMAESLTWEIALVVDPEWEARVPDKDFLAKVLGSNPNYTGWPIWLDSRSFREAKDRPVVHDGAWEAIIASTVEDWSAHLDFMRLDPRGRFYLRRALQDDQTPKVAPATALDPILMIVRVAEAIAVGIAITKTLIGEGAPRRLGFAFKWTGLANRILKTWATPSVLMIGERRAHDNEVSTYVELPSDTPVNAIAPAVQTATRGLFALFDGEVIPSHVIEDWSNRLIERRLT